MKVVLRNRVFYFETPPYKILKNKNLENKNLENKISEYRFI